MIDDLCEQLARELGEGRARRSVMLAPFTTFRVGGPADCLVEVRSADEMVRALSVARRCGAPVTVLGGGSNVLVADGGVRGLVVRLRGGAIRSAGDRLVAADAGASLNLLVRWTVGRGLAGFEAWAGTPGTVGGALYGNAHWKGRAIGDMVVTAQLLSPEGDRHVVEGSQLGFGYDSSRLQTTGEWLLQAEFRVEPGADPVRLRAVARESLAFRKRTQPLRLPSAGCAFRNPDPTVDALPADVPPSAGALIDRAGLKGARCGGASVSTLHANFIVNDGGATAVEIRALIERCRDEVRRRFGVTLRDEIVYLGSFEA